MLGPTRNGWIRTGELPGSARTAADSVLTSSNVVDEGATMASTCLTGQRPRCVLEAGFFEGLDVIEAVAHFPR